jgi:HAD superfamily hydrolase (TIGR01509 family)
MIGTSLPNCLTYVLEQTGIPMTREDLARDYSAHLAALIDEGVELMPGVMNVLGALTKYGCPLGVASNSPTAYIAKTTSQVGIGAYFSCMVGADHVEHPKPAPDVYRKAAAALGVAAEACLAVEDSPSGAGSAKAAGMRCILIPDPDLARSA